MGDFFTVIMDHKLLTAILGPQRGVPPLAAACMQRWALLLSAYSYDIRFRPTQSHGNADSLSHLPLPDTHPVGNCKDPTIFNLAQLDALPIQATDITAATRTDPILSKVLHCSRKGWSREVSEALCPFWQRRDELTVEGDWFSGGLQ